MSDMYSLIAQLSVATAQKQVVRVCNIMSLLVNEMTVFNAMQGPIVEEAKEFLQEYLDKNSTESLPNKETLN